MKRRRVVKCVAQPAPPPWEVRRSIARAPRNCQAGIGRAVLGSFGTERLMIVEPDYRGHRIEGNAVHVDGVWNAEVCIRRLFSEEKPHVETITCRVSFLKTRTARLSCVF